LKPKKDHYNSKKTKFFRKIEKVLDYISEKTVIFYSKYRRFFSTTRQTFGKAEEAFAKLSGNHASPEQLF
jgi:transcription-repair coupling factor (superfamily II helicase)